MTEIPDGLLYTAEHEWLRVEGDVGVIGITAHAAEQLGDVTYVELPEVGAQLAQGAALGLLESVKAVSDVYAPASGPVLEANGRLATEPQLVNESPYGEGWMCRVQIADQAELGALLSPQAYAELLQREGD